MLRKELVSTIIPVFNRPRMLREAVESVLGQSYRPIEIVIVDDGSTDETPSVADDIQRQNGELVKVLHMANCGPGLARESGRRAVTGEFVQYLDSDDLLLRDKFELQVNDLRRNPDCGISYCKTRYRDPTGNVVTDAWKRTGETIRTLFPSMLLSRWWATSTPLYRRSVVESVGPWSDLTNEEDWEYDCRVGARGIELHFVPETLLEVRGHQEGRASDNGVADPSKLASRARAHEMIHRHAVAAGIEPAVPEMQHFSRELFLLSRQCGAAGLVDASRRLFELSRESSSSHHWAGLDYLVYGAGARVVGWRVMGKASEHLDRIRNLV
ncbi:MAG: glycosyltransferase family 2 protein [Gammaproteobacteria bacterium]|nr:glycosyltransferase family 2 protein [Gammaproteobacteria bacterium]